jgi:DNA polymerase-1
MSVKKYFISRYKDGYILEADYSQLEIRVLAELSGDATLKKDLLSSDLHAIRAAQWKKKNVEDVTNAERNAAKRISFQLQYGAGYKSIAETNDITVEEAKAFVKAYYDRYPQVSIWQDLNIGLVESSRVPSTHRTTSGLPAGKGQLVCPVTQRRYTFFEKDGYHGGASFYSPEIKNYPVQGLATGDIVPLVLGRLMRRLLHEELECKLINTVHDSIILDVEESKLLRAGRVLKETMEMAPTFIKNDYNYEWTTPLPVDVNYGRDWEHLTPLEL